MILELPSIPGCALNLPGHLQPIKPTQNILVLLQASTKESSRGAEEDPEEDPEEDLEGDCLCG